jgi:catechol 2,3-dioxygenase-like lactoylglutathione lyase family enzyme
MTITPTTTVNVRYMVGDVETAIAWYTKHLGFTVLSNAAPAFADVSLGSLRLLLSGPGSSAGRPMPDGARPARQGVGTEFNLLSTISPPRSQGCVPREYSSATIL